MPSALCASCGAGGQAAAAKGHRGFRGRRDGVLGARSRGQRQPNKRQPVLSGRARPAARGSTRTPAHPRTRHAHTHGSTHSSRHVTWSLSFPSLPCSQPRPLLVRLRLDKCQRVTLLSSRQIPNPKSSTLFLLAHARLAWVWSGRAGSRLRPRACACGRYCTP